MEYSFKILYTNVFSLVTGDRGWFRIFGYGLKWKHIKYGLLFSERYNYNKYLKFNNYYISILKNKIKNKENKK